MKRAEAVCDGRGNAGPEGACAFVLALPDGREIERAKKLEGEPSNNEAEYEAVSWCLLHALNCGVTHLTIKSDSQLIVNQLKGNYKIKEERLRPCWERAMHFARHFEEIEIVWVRREHTQRPDKLCRDLFAPVAPPARRKRPAPLAEKPKENPFLRKKNPFLRS